MADDELTRKIGTAIVVVTTPDVCKAPTVPTPFVSYSKFDLSIKTADTVRMTSCVSFTKESRLSMTMADQGGVGGGVKSQVVGGMCRPFKGWSSTVRAQGSEICRHDVIMEVNCAGPDGPGNTFGKVIYVETLCCASVTPAGEIVVDQDESAKATDPANENDTTSKPSGKTTSEEVGELGSEMKERASQRWEEAKQAGSDLYDYGKEVYEDPGKLYEDAKQAGNDAWEATKREAGEVWEKGPVDYTKDEVGEAWENSQAKKDWGSGNYGGAVVDGAIEAGKWFLGLKAASKVAEKMPLPKRRKKGDGDHDSDKDSKKDDKEEKTEKEEEKKSGDDGEASGEDGGIVAKPKAKGGTKDDHSKERHGPNRDKSKYPDDKKSHFDSDADIDKVQKESDNYPSVTNTKNGNKVTVFESSVEGTAVNGNGISGRTNTMTVVTKPDGTVITTHPGTPHNWGKTGAYN